MKANVGSADRAVRIALGLGLILPAIAGAIGPWGWIGIVPLVTGLVRVCPLYSIVSFNASGTRS